MPPHQSIPSGSLFSLAKERMQEKKMSGSTGHLGSPTQSLRRVVKPLGEHNRSRIYSPAVVDSQIRDKINVTKGMKTTPRAKKAMTATGGGVDLTRRFADSIHGPCSLATNRTTSENHQSPRGTPLLDRIREECSVSHGRDRKAGIASKSSRLRKADDSVKKVITFTTSSSETKVKSLRRKEFEAQEWMHSREVACIDSYRIGNNTITPPPEPSKSPALTRRAFESVSKQGTSSIEQRNQQEEEASSTLATPPPQQTSSPDFLMRCSSLPPSGMSSCDAARFFPMSVEKNVTIIPNVHDPVKCEEVEEVHEWLHSRDLTCIDSYSIGDTTPSPQPSKSPILTRRAVSSSGKGAGGAGSLEDEYTLNRRQQEEVNLASPSPEPSREYREYLNFNDPYSIGSTTPSPQPSKSPELTRRAIGSGSGGSFKEDSTLVESQQPEEEVSNLHTPSPQPTYSPEFLKRGSVPPSSGACFGAGPLMGPEGMGSVKDRRKCKPRGILTIEGDFLSSSGSGDFSDEIQFKEMISVPAMASVEWMVAEGAEFEALSVHNSISSELLDVDESLKISPGSFSLSGFLDQEPIGLRAAEEDVVTDQEFWNEWNRIQDL